MTSKKSNNNPSSSSSSKSSSSNRTNSISRRHSSRNNRQRDILSSSSSSNNQASSSNDIMSPTPYTSTSSSQSPPAKSTKAAHTNTNKEETDSITNDDLEAMKAMIGDIKKDPSLLYRLSNLSGAPSDDKHGAAGNTNSTTRATIATKAVNSSPPLLHRSSGGTSSPTSNLRESLNINDDSTEVSSIGMMSSGDYNSYLHPTPLQNYHHHHGGGGNNNIQMMMMMGGNHAEFANATQVAGLVPTTTPSNNNRTTNNEQQQQGGMPTIMMASPEQPPNQARTNRDAEIALRMQSLRAMRDWNKQQQQQAQQQQAQQQQQSSGGGRKGSPTNIIATNNSNGGGGGGGAAITSPSTTPRNVGSSSRGENQNDHHEDYHSQQQQPQSLPPPIQSPPLPTDTKSSSSRRREGKSSSSSSGGGVVGGSSSKSSKSRSRRKDTNSRHRNVDNNSNNSDDDRRRNEKEDQDSQVEHYDNDQDEMMGVDPIDELYAPQRNHGGGGNNNSSRQSHGGGGSSMMQSNLDHQLQQQQQQEDERALRRISEATTETSTTNLTASSFQQGSSPLGNTWSGRSSRSSNKGGGSGGGGGRPSLGQRSASHGAYISGSQSVQDGGHYHQRQQRQPPPPSHQSSSFRKQRSFHGSSPPEPNPSSTQYGRRNTHNEGFPSPSKHSFHDNTSYSRRNTTNNDESSSPSKHSFHESSSSSLHLSSMEKSRPQHRRRNTAASEQGIYSRSLSYSDDHRIHGGVYDGRVQPQQQRQQQHSRRPQDHRRSQSFSANEQNNYHGDHSGSSEDRSYEVHQLAKLYAQGGTPDRSNSDGRGDAAVHPADEPGAPSRLLSSSYEEEGRHYHQNHHQHSQQPSSNRGKHRMRFSMNDATTHEDKSTNQYNTPEKHSPDNDNLEVNAKAKSVSMIITDRDAKESRLSPTRKSKKSSKKSSRGSDEKKKSKRSSKSKVQDVPPSEAKDTLNPVSPSEAMGSSESSERALEGRATSPGKKSSFHGRIRRLARQSSTDFNTSSSSASVMDRLSNPLRSLKSPSKDSIHRASPQSGSSGYQDDPSDAPRRLTLDSTNVSDDHDSHTPQKHKKSKLISRLVTSPTQQLDNSGSISIADDYDDHAVSMGIELALMTGDVPRLCDAKGRCLFHPHIRLQKAKLFGGWKILFKHCPDCAVEHMRATQDMMAEKKKKKRRERKSEEKKRSEEKKKSDPIIEMNVGDDDFTPKKSKKKKKKPRDDGENKEEHQELLQLPPPAPEPSREEEDDQTEMSDAITNFDPSYQDSRAIVEHKPPRSKKVNGLPWSDYNGQSGRYTGEVNEKYLPHGRGEMVYDKGIVSAGIWYNGVLDTEEPVSMDGYVPNRLSNYEIGDKGSDEDMIIASKRETAAAVAQLRVNDAAFVRRSDGSWTYAVMKDQVDDGRNRSIRFKVNTRGSTKSFPPSQWGTYIRCINSRTEINTNRRSDAQTKRSAPGLGEYLDSNNRRSAQPSGHSSHSLAGNFTGYSGDVSVSSTHSAPVLDRSRCTDNLTTAKMRIKSRSRSRGRKNVTTLPLLFSSSMSVSEEAEDDTSDEWETASGSGYRLRGIDP